MRQLEVGPLPQSLAPVDLLLHSHSTVSAAQIDFAQDSLCTQVVKQLFPYNNACNTHSIKVQSLLPSQQFPEKASTMQVETRCSTFYDWSLSGP